ncbi:MAG: GntR family transcriptional regulator [Firmicutes bacterium]|nr:GntR family transcriptional regulator [Bacillota bacterium]
MEFDQHLPIYMQIMHVIKNRIVSGQLRGGDKLPSVRDLAKEFKVNPNTIQRCYQELERENLVFTQRGLGTFVTEDVETIKNLKTGMAQELTQNYLEQMQRLGFTPQEIIKLISTRVNRRDDHD